MYVCVCDRSARERAGSGVGWRSRTERVWGWARALSVRRRSALRGRRRAEAALRSERLGPPPPLPPPKAHTVRVSVAPRPARRVAALRDRRLLSAKTAAQVRAGVSLHETWALCMSGRGARSRTRSAFNSPSTWPPLRSPTASAGRRPGESRWASASKANKLGFALSVTE